MAKRNTRTAGKSSKWKRSIASRKRRSGKAGRLVGLGRYLILVLGLAAGYQFGVRPVAARISSHPIFTVQHIEVKGSEYIDGEALVDAADVDLGVNIFDIDVARISENLRNRFAADEFTVYKTLPNTITIRVHEKEPVALLNADGLIGVDRNGVPLNYVGAELVADLPIVTGIGNVAALGDSAVRARLVSGLELLERIKEEAPSTYLRISELNVAEMGSLGVSLVDNGIEVIIGDGDWSRKLAVLDRVINRAVSSRDGVKALDIRFGDVVVVR